MLMANWMGVKHASAAACGSESEACMHQAVHADIRRLLSSSRSTCVTTCLRRGAAAEVPRACERAAPAQQHQHSSIGSVNRLTLASPIQQPAAPGWPRPVLWWGRKVNLCCCPAAGNGAPAGLPRVKSAWILSNKQLRRWMDALMSSQDWRCLRAPSASSSRRGPRDDGRWTRNLSFPLGTESLIWS